MVPGSTYRGVTGDENTVGWTEASLQHFSGMQFTLEERVMRHRKQVSFGFQMPMLAEVKDSVVSLLQLTDSLIYLHIREDGVGVVGLIIRHGLLMDSQKGIPVLDLSVCFLSSQTSLEMANAVHHLNPAEGMRQVNMWNEQYTLFQNLCNYTRTAMAPTLRVEHPSLRQLIKKKRARSQFRRVLLKPLFPSAGEFEEALNAFLGGSFSP